MKFHVITGLPRAGSTLLCNILNQNPNFYASSTSDLCFIVSQIVSAWSNSVEIKNELNQDRKKAEEKMHKALRSFTDSWYSDQKKKIVFDKSRSWGTNSIVLKSLYPDSKIIVLVRDLKNVFASIEKQHRNSPLLDEAKTPQEKTIYDRADKMFAPQGIIGSAVLGIEDLIRRKPKGVIFIQYESLASDPEGIIKTLYKNLEEKCFKHDFKNVKNTATDPDGFYLQKYPHKGEGRVKPSDQFEWKKYVSEDLAKVIMTKFTAYNRFFGY